MALAMGERSEKCRKLLQNNNSALPKARAQRCGRDNKSFSASSHGAPGQPEGRLFHGGG